MQRLRALIDRVLMWMLVVLVGVAVVNVLWQVFTRWVLADPSSYTEELARFLLIWIGLLGSAYAVGGRLHLAIELLPERLDRRADGGRSRHLLEIVIQAAVAAFAVGVMIVGGLRLVHLTLRFEQTSAALGVPLAWVYLVIPLSGALIVFYAAALIAERIGLLRGGRPGGATPSERTTTRPID